MPSHLSDLCQVVAIEGAGRGVTAAHAIGAGVEILAYDGLAAHVIFREYRKEVCSNCFLYDRGRTLPVRCNELGKVFCTPNCKQRWLSDTHELGIDAWRRLTTFVNANSKHISVPTEQAIEGPRPSADEIKAVWQVERPAKTRGPSVERRAIDPDVLGVLLSAVLVHHHDTALWGEAMELTMDETPYKSFYELSMHHQGFRQLREILPEELKPSCTAEICLNIIQAGSHNAFGIRAGGEDAEEYMGYAIYPQASYFNHSCAPNLAKKRVGRSWYFFCDKDVASDEQLCISYLGGDEKDLDLAERRARLESIWGFICQCHHCIAEERQQQEQTTGG